MSKDKTDNGMMKASIYEGKLNDKHEPSLKLKDIELMPGWILLHRPARPAEEEFQHIVRPGSVEHAKDPNCAVIVKVGPDCKSKVGDYAVWCYGERFDQPVPIVPHYTDFEPGYYGFKEEWLMATIKAK